MSTNTAAEKRILDAFAGEFCFCWACGNHGFGSFSGLDYPRHLAIAHIIGGAGRKPHDRRNLARLCTMCHDLSHGSTIRHNGRPLPQLKLRHVLWLKHKFDREHYDRRFLRSLRPKIMPPAQEPPRFFRQQFEQYRGCRWTEAVA